MEQCKLEQVGYEGFEKVVDMIGGKWKLRLLFFLATHKVLRYGELKQLATPITHRMLSTQLKELEESGLIIRTQYLEMPPRVDYRLSEKAVGLMPVFDKLADWINKFNVVTTD